MLARPEHAMWIIIQQVTVRGLIALKFLLAARLLGPDQIGLVGVATLSLAVVEALTDTGLASAVVQSHNKINSHDTGAVWTIQLTRGFVLAVLLYGLAGPISQVFKIPESMNLIALAAVMPLLRNALNPGVFLVQRDRNFRQLSIYEASAALVDLVITLLLIQLGYGSASILLGNMAGDSLKLVLSWSCFRAVLTPNFQWRLIKSLTAFGKWIWASSIVTLVLNQLDKVLVARFLGPTDFGLYQVASRIAQLVVTDGAMALGQYLYPTFAQHHRFSQKDARKYLCLVLRRWVPLAAIIASLLAILSSVLVSIVLGTEWSDAVPLLRVLSVPMFLGAVIVILVAYLRGTGRPRAVTEATLIQLFVFLAFAPVLFHYYSAVGLASSLAVAGTASAIFMFWSAYRIK